MIFDLINYLIFIRFNSLFNSLNCCLILFNSFYYNSFIILLFYCFILLFFLYFRMIFELINYLIFIRFNSLFNSLNCCLILFNSFYLNSLIILLFYCFILLFFKYFLMIFELIHYLIH